jgi:NAD(P)-dependent dehydrogenase (short-subunit alcohol dehydrogenase family)
MTIWERPDILINSSGVGGGGTSVADMETSKFDPVIRTDLYKPINMVQPAEHKFRDDLLASNYRSWVKGAVRSPPIIL